MEFGDWQAFLDTTLNHFLKHNDLVEKFSRLKTDYEKVHFCQSQEYMQKAKWIESYFENVNTKWKNLKCSKKSAELRQSGNKLYQKKHNQDALESYNLSIQYAPYPGNGDTSEAYAMGVANRSAVLYHMQHYQLCLRDVDHALESGYPETLRYKLMQRRANCLMRLQQYQDAKQAYTETLRYVKCSDLDPVKKGHGIFFFEENLISEVKNQMSKMPKNCHVGNDSIKDEDTNIKISHGISSKLDNCSAAVELQHTTEKGRFLVANQLISAGDVLIKEKPFAAVLLPTHDNSHCHHCYTAFIAPVPCRHCITALFCSELCRSRSWQQYHWLECPYLDLLRSVGVAHLSLRIVMTAGLQFLQEYRHQLTRSASDADSLGISADSGTYGCSYHAVYHLMTHADHMDPEDVLQYALTANLLLKCLKYGGFFDKQMIFKNTRRHLVSDDFSQMSLNGDIEAIESLSQKASPSTFDMCNQSSINDSEKSTSIASKTNPASYNGKYEVPDSDNDSLFIGGLLLRHTQQLICNAHAITELQAKQISPDVDAQNQVRIATAVYPTVSLMNHACDPTIIASFQNDTLIVRAIKNVPPGGEIFNCYGPHYGRMRRADRQDILLSQYFFCCRCPACEEDAHEDTKYQAFRCADCDGWIQAKQCVKCGRECDVSYAAQQMALSTNHLVTGLSLMEKSNMRDALEELMKCVQLRSEVLFRHNQDLAEARDHVARCHAMLGNYKKAAKYLLKSITTTEEIYGSNSIELANELHKYAQVLFNGREIPDVLRTINRAVDIFTVHYGPECSQNKELMDMKMCVQEYVISQQ